MGLKGFLNYIVARRVQKRKRTHKCYNNMILIDLLLKRLLVEIKRRKAVSQYFGESTIFREKSRSHAQAPAFALQQAQGYGAASREPREKH